MKKFVKVFSIAVVAIVVGVSLSQAKNLRSVTSAGDAKSAIECVCPVGGCCSDGHCCCKEPPCTCDECKCPCCPEATQGKVACTQKACCAK
jgi:hypothetical protein